MTDDQPQKPSEHCNYCGAYDGGFAHKTTCRPSVEATKPSAVPDASPREWSILCVGDIADGSDKIVVTEGPWNSNEPSIKLVEKSSYDALKARVAEVIKEKIELADALENNGAAQAIRECVDENEKLQALLEEMAGALKHYEHIPANIRTPCAYGEEIRFSTRLIAEEALEKYRNWKAGNESA